MSAETNPGPEISPAAPAQSSWSERAKQLCRRTVWMIPAKLRWAMIAAGVLAIGLYLYSSLHSAKLKVTGRHAFRNAAVSVAIDGNTVFNEQVTGTAKKRLGLLPKFEASFSKTVDVEAGEHTVAVRVVSASDHFDQTKQCAVKLASGREGTLVVSSGKNGTWLQFQGGGPSLPPPSPASDYASYVRSVLLTIGGSALSAAIGFLVQDFLKSKKTGVAAPQQSSPNS